MLVFEIGVRTESGHFYDLHTAYSKEDAQKMAQQVADDNKYLEIVIMEKFYTLAQTTPFIYRHAVNPEDVKGGDGA